MQKAPLKPSTNLIKLQRNLLTALISQSPSTWQILIFDNPTRNIFSSQLKLAHLRSYNVTLYFNLNQNREQLLGVTAIYAIMPTLQNVERIAKDMEAELYGEVVVHFIEEPAAQIMGMLAKRIAKIKGAANKIIRVQYSTVGMHVLDPKMAILPGNGSMLNLILALKHPPLFVYDPKDSQLVQTLKLRLQNSPYATTSFQNATSYTLFLIFNRELDMFPVLSHGITYSGLIESVLGVHPMGWRIGAEGDKRGIIVDLNDQILGEKKNQDITGLQLDKQLNKIKNRMISVGSQKQEYTQLQVKHKSIEWHLSTAGILLQQAKKRSLNIYHNLQTEIYTKRSLSSESKKDLQALLEEATTFPLDKVRIMSIYLLYVEHIDLKQVEIWENLYPDIKKNEYYSKIKEIRKKEEEAAKGNASSKYIKKLAKGIWANLLQAQKKYLLVKYIEKCNNLNEPDFKDLGLNIATLNNIQLPLLPKFAERVAYVRGGVCFNEFENVMRWEPNVIYAGDKMTNASDYV